MYKKAVWGSFAVLVLSALGAQAAPQFDASLGGAARSYPVGGALEADLGGSLLLWGEGPGSSGTVNPWYGYTRLGVQMATAGSYNEAGAQVEVFPVSIFGAKLGASSYENSKDYSAYDCEAFSCQGKVSSQFASVHLALGVGNIFLISSAKRKTMKQKDDEVTGLYVDPSSGLSAQPDNDTVESLTGILAYKVSEIWTVAVSNIHWQMEESEGYSRMSTLNVGYSMDDWSFYVGGGTFQSSLKEAGGTVNAIVNWKIKPSYALF